MTPRALPAGSGVIALAAVALAAAVAATALLAPVAGAQVPTEFPTSVEVRIHPFERPVKPLAGVAVLTAHVRYSHFSGVPALEPTQVHLRVAEQPAWATVSVSPTTLSFDPHPAAVPSTVQVHEQQVQVLVTTTADAPAFTPGTVRLKAIAEPNFPYGASTGEDGTLVTADYFGLLNVHAPDGSVTVGRDEVPVALTVRNLGNGPTRVTVSVVDAPDGVKIGLPAPFVLQSKQTGGKQVHQDVTVDVRAPNGLNAPGTVKLRVDGAYALDSSIKGASTIVEIDVEPEATRAPEGAAQAGALGLLGGGVGVAAAFRRWRGGAP